MATKRATRRPADKNPPAPKDDPAKIKTKAKAASPRRVRLTPAQKELLDQVREGVRTGDYGVLQTADPAVLQSLWDLKLIQVRTVSPAMGVSRETRERIKRAVRAAKKQD